MSNHGAGKPAPQRKEYNMTHLTRDKRTGDYYTPDRKYFIEKGTAGWNVYESTTEYGVKIYKYSFSCDTLREVKESL